ncbi:MAG: IS66 family transposase [Treponema sp.]|nr:IS66 family transposase [Treponema sp.]
MDNKVSLIDGLLKKIEEQAFTILKLEETKASLAETNGQLLETINGLQCTIKEQEAKIKELEGRLNLNSQNSSKPPSTDGFNKPKSQRTKSILKCGGQHGHKGSNMEIPHEADETIPHFPFKCQSCPHFAECAKSGNVFVCGEKRYVVDVVVTTKVTEHLTMGVSSCPCGEKIDSGEFPDEIRAYVQYGDSVSVLVGLLSTYGAVSDQRIHVLLGSLMGVSLSTGTISSMVSRCARKVDVVMENVKATISRNEIVHFDETGTDVNGKTMWVHNSSTPEFTYQTISNKRGKAGMDFNGVLPDFSGIAVHDCWPPYWKFDKIQHSVCNAHLLRELTGVEQNNPEHKWAKDFKSLLMSMKSDKEEAVKCGLNKFSDEKLEYFLSEYDRLMKLADEECPEPVEETPHKKGRKKKGKERALIVRLQKYKGSVCLFASNFSVPFDNNQAERDQRNVKVKTKVSGCFRTTAGAQNYLNVMSYISTGQKHGVSAIDALNSAFAGNASIVLQKN